QVRALGGYERAGVRAGQTGLLPARCVPPACPRPHNSRPRRGLCPRTHEESRKLEANEDRFVAPCLCTPGSPSLISAKRDAGRDPGSSRIETDMAGLARDKVCTARPIVSAAGRFYAMWVATRAATHIAVVSSCHLARTRGGWSGRCCCRPRRWPRCA